MLDLSVAMFDFQRVPPSTEPLSRYISSWGRLQRVPWRASTWSRMCAQKKQQPTSVRITKPMQLVWVYNSVFIYVYQ